MRHVAGRLDIYCSVVELLADERAHAILLKAVGQEMLDRARIPWLAGQTLEGLGRLVPNLATPELLQNLQQQLLALS